MFLGQAVALASIALAGALVLQPWRWIAATSAMAVVDATDSILVQRAMYVAGIEPDALATAGVSASTTELIALDAGEWWTSHGQSLTAAELQASIVSSEVIVMERARRRGSVEYSVEDLLEARNRETSAQAVLDDLRADFSEALLERISAEQAAQIRQIVANRTWDAPQEFGVLAMPEADWRSTKDALCAEASDVEADSDDADTLAEVRANPVYTLAKTNRESLEAAVIIAWKEVFPDE